MKSIKLVYVISSIRKHFIEIVYNDTWLIRLSSKFCINKNKLNYRSIIHMMLIKYESHLFYWLDFPEERRPVR